MADSKLQGIFKKFTLSESELLLIRQLALVCESYENLHIPIAWSSLRDRPDTMINDFLYYEDGELIGYLALNDFDPLINDVTGMVHPVYRRRGIFRQLLHAAQEESRSRGERQLVLICEQASRSGLAFVQATGASHIVSEHEMLLTNYPGRQAFDERLTFRRAESSDLASIIKIQSTSFQAPEDVTMRRVLHHARDPRRAYYLLTYGEEPTGCQEPVGCLRLDQSEQGIGLFALSILPDYQGRGYGRQLLEEAIDKTSYSHKPLSLFVNVENARAINLYRSCGFSIKTTYGYYLLNL